MGFWKDGLVVVVGTDANVVAVFDASSFFSWFFVVVVVVVICFPSLPFLSFFTFVWWAIPLPTYPPTRTLGSGQREAMRQRETRKNGGKREVILGIETKKKGHWEVLGAVSHRAPRSSSSSGGCFALHHLLYRSLSVCSTEYCILLPRLLLLLPFTNATYHHFCNFDLLRLRHHFFSSLISYSRGGRGRVKGFHSPISLNR
jgi:hypothetical protein